MSEPDIGKRMYHHGVIASSVDDVENYMAYWHVRTNVTDWNWAPLGPDRLLAGDREIWQEWVEREVEAGRVKMEPISNGNRYTFTDAWFERVAHIIMRYKLASSTDDNVITLW